MGETCTISLLGAFRVEVGGRAIAADAWRHRRGADLVKLLALAPAHRLHREQVMEALWPELGADAAAANLRKAVHFARRALGSEAAIVTDASMVALWPSGELVVDVDRFEAAAEVALRSESPEAAAEAGEWAGGELLPEDRYAGWTEKPRARLRQRSIEVCKAAGMWERALAFDPADEEAHRALMRAAFDAGNRHGAIRRFEQLRAALREELGVSPDATSVALYEQVLDMEGDEPPSPAELAGALVARAIVHWNRKELADAERTAEQARDLALQHDLWHELGEASGLLALVALQRGEWRALFRRDIVEAIRHTTDAVRAVFDAHLCFAEFSLYGPEGHESVEPLARELLSVAEEAGSVEGQAIGWLMLGEADLLSGRFDPAEEKLARAVALAEEGGWTSCVTLALQRLAEATIGHGRRWRAGRLLGRARGLAERSELEPHLLVRVLGAMVDAAAEPARSVAVLDDAEAALAGRRVCEPCSIGYHVVATSSSARAGDAARAAGHLDDAERIARMWQGGAWTAAVWEARGTVRLAEGEPAQAAALFREAAEGFARAGRPVDEARCRAAITEILIS